MLADNRGACPCGLSLPAWQGMTWHWQLRRQEDTFKRGILGGLFLFFPVSGYCRHGGRGPTGVVDRGHLESTGGQRGLGLEPIPFKGRHRCEEMVLVPSVLLGQTGKLAVAKKKKKHAWILFAEDLNPSLLTFL